MMVMMIEEKDETVRRGERDEMIQKSYRMVICDDDDADDDDDDDGTPHVHHHL